MLGMRTVPHRAISTCFLSEALVLRSVVESVLKHAANGGSPLPNAPGIGRGMGLQDHVPTA